MLDLLSVSRVVGTNELLGGFDKGIFAEKLPGWWVEAGARLVACHPDEELFERPFLLSEDRTALGCQPEGQTQRPIVFGAPASAFAARWKLLERLHEDYGGGDAGRQVLDWLEANAAFTSHVDAETELAAFAERFADKPVAIEDEELRDLRTHFDGVSDRRTEKLGPKVGAALLLDGYTYKAGKQERLKVSPTRAYLCKTLDGENSSWPAAAGLAPGVPWIAARYNAELKTAAGRWAKRRGKDGIISRGPRRFLMMLGAETGPRLVRTERVRWGSEARVRELRAKGAEQVEYDEISPDLSRVLEDLQKVPKRDAKRRSPFLLRALSRNWERLYARRQTVPSEHEARVYIYNKGPVTAAWLNELRETEWVAVGRGELVAPHVAVVRTLETQTVYGKFVCEIGPHDINEGLAKALHLITDVRVGDLLTRLAELRDGAQPVDEGLVLQIYRTIASAQMQT